MIDVSVIFQLIIFVQYFCIESEIVEIKFFFVQDVLKEYDVVIVQVIYDLFKEEFFLLQLDVKDVMGLVIDGVFVMVGLREGVVFKLK